MPIDTPHPEHSAFIDQWTRCRDAVAGEDCIKEKGEIYLPRLSGHEKKSYLSREKDPYEIYKDRATFHGILSNTISAYAGAAFLTPPQIDFGSERMQLWAEDVDGSDLSLVDHIRHTFDDLLTVGRAVVFVDMAPMGGDPYLVRRRAEDVINWAHDETGKLSLVVIKECVYQAEEGDRYRMEAVTQWRELLLEDGLYLQRLWVKRKEDGGDFVQVGEDIIPRKGGQAFDFIPIVFFGPSGFQTCPEKPPLLDATNLNIAHYRNSADYEQILHTLACGTPYIFGLNSDETPSAIGPGTLWSGKNSDVKLGILEFSGEGVSALKQAMEDKLAAMVAVGAKLIEKAKTQAETAETTRLKSTAEHSTLVKIVDVLAAGYEKLLIYVAFWMGAPDSVSIEMSHDFVDDGWVPQELAAISAAVMDGVISREAGFYALNSKGFFPSGRTFEDEAGALEQGTAQPANSLL